LSDAANTLETQETRALIESFHKASEQIRAEVRKIIVGQDDVVEHLLMTLLVGGHCLITGMPGTAKTLLVRTLASALGLKFKRIQFTPDLMPTDVTGTDILEEDVASGRRTWTFVPGPLFTNVLLADEINRTPPKTQSALLEAMQEFSVTVRGHHHNIDRPFFVLATQNPIELEGTYPLPEAPRPFPVQWCWITSAEMKSRCDKQHLAHGSPGSMSATRRRSHHSSGWCDRCPCRRWRSGRGVVRASAPAIDLRRNRSTRWRSSCRAVPGTGRKVRAFFSRYHVIEEAALACRCCVIAC
jgi:hypothetical protein